MLYFDKKFLAANGGEHHKAQFKHTTQVREAFNINQLTNPVLQVNGAAIIPQDVFREFDNQTTKLMRANNLALLNDLLPLAKPLPVGKIEHVHRRVSDSGVVKSSLSGQTTTDLDKAAYDYDSSIKVIHQTGFGREWMEVQAQRAEAFDALIDDQANATRAIMNKMADHIYNGVGGINFKGFVPYGIKTSSKVQAVDLDSSGLNIDFTSAEGAAVRTAWVKLVDALRITNNVTDNITFYVSREIMSNFEKYYTTNDVGFGTIFEALLKLSQVAGIKVDASLSGNEVVGMVLDSQFIRPLVGMAVSTVPIARLNPFDNYNFVTWTNIGLEIKNDYTGKKGVLYARVIP